MSFLARKQNSESAAKPSQVPLGKNALLFGVVLFTAIIFLPAVRYDFVYDDNGQIVSNALIRSWRFVPQYFQGHVWQYLYPNAAGNYYRPLNVLWWRINYALFGVNAPGWHAATIALHLLATALVFAIARRISRRPLVAAVTALLFGIHPTRHEVVAWVSGSTESLLAVFFFSAFLAYLLSRESRKVFWAVVSCALYAAGLLAKETAIVLPALIFVHASLYGVQEEADVPQSQTFWQRLWAAALRTSVYVPIAILYLVIRVRILHGFSHRETVMTLSSLLLTLPSVLFFYLKQWLLPFRISEIYDVAVQTQWNLWHVLVPMVALAVAAALLWFLRRKLGPRELLFALAAVAFPLAPVLYISVFPIGEVVHDRYAYLPGFGAAFLTALALQQLCQGKLVLRLPRGLVLALLVIVLPLSYSTAEASSYWVTDFSLFEHAHRMAPENVLAQNNYAIELSRQGDVGTAIKILQKLVDEHPKYFLPTYNLGRVYYDAGLLGPAYHYLQVARNIEPDMPDVFSQMGLVSLKLDRRDEALFNFQYAVALRPDDARNHFALGVIWAQRGDCDQARAQFSEALSLEPTLVKAREQRDKCKAGVQAAAPEAKPGGGTSPAAVPRATAPLTTVKGR